ncbi:MAG: hypothetical protein HW421_3069 [Ignavibacteria bacterium]|nr:hypothetical protein [Ignavibacteria bacterium]
MKNIVEINSGAYQIYLELSRDCKIQIGVLGKFTFKKGKYVYTGSAMKNLLQRVARHKSKSKKIKWHIDYLLACRYAKINEIAVYPSLEKKECELNMELVNRSKVTVPVPNFGSSDCRSCPAHLVYLENV